MKKIRAAVEKAGLLLGVLLAGFLIAEVVLAAMGLPRSYKAPFRTAQFKMTSDPEGAHYTNAPLSEIRFVYDGDPRGYFGPGGEITHVTNSLGFRGPEFPAQKKEQSVRMAFLGDSFTFGEGVRFEDTYPERTAVLLNQKFAREGVLFESLNFGVGGYNTVQEWELLERTVAGFSPDILVVGYALNDAEPELFRMDPATQEWERRQREQVVHEGVADLPAPGSFWSRARILRCLWRINETRDLSRKMTDFYHALYDADKNPAWESNRKSLGEILRVCVDRKVHCYVVLFPLIYQLNDRYPFREVHARIRAEVAGRGAGYIHFIDLFDHFKGRRERDLWVHPTDQHPNEIAHAIAAHVLAERIAETAIPFKSTDA